MKKSKALGRALCLALLLASLTALLTGCHGARESTAFETGTLVKSAFCFSSLLIFRRLDFIDNYPHRKFIALVFIFLKV